MTDGERFWRDAVEPANDLNSRENSFDSSRAISVFEKIMLRFFPFEHRVDFHLNEMCDSGISEVVFVEVC